MKTAVVTGATRGIGAAIAAALRVRGCDVLGVSRSGVIEYRNDLSDARQVDQLCGHLRFRGDVDILVNNAGTNRPAPTADYLPDDLEYLLRLNVVAPFRLSQAVLPGMIARGWGRIVNIGSIWGAVGRPERTAYSVTKFGIDGLTASLAAEVARKGVLVNTVAPGFIATELTKATAGEEWHLAEQVPVGRFGTPEEVAGLVAWLCLDNTYVSGQRILIDGGLSRV